jgi:DNA polymerase-1
MDAECLIAHNGIGFDFPVIPKLYGRGFRGRLIDTLVLCRILWPAEVLAGPDFARAKAGKMPMQLVKRHSLEAWGWRTGQHKGNYTGGFASWSLEMAEYLDGDIDGLRVLWELIQKRLASPIAWPQQAIDDEMKVAEIIYHQQLGGVTFDRPKAITLAASLANLQVKIEERLVETFGSWWQPLQDPEVGTEPAIDRDVKLVGYEDVTVPRFGKPAKDGTPKELAPYVGPPKCEYRKGQPYVDIEWTTFQPSSRDHLGMRLKAVFGWKPKAFGKNGKPTVDETVLSEIPEAVMPEATRKLILDYFVVTKTLGMLSKGKKSWIGLCEDDGKVHGQMGTADAITRRGIHRNPNLSQTPGVKKEKVELPDGRKIEQVLKGLEGKYGWECRELFTADPDWEQTGIDASALELIDLGHYLHHKDGGAFSARVCDPNRDPHAEHAELAGMLRADAKTAIYLKVYGGSAWKLSLDIDIADDEIVSNLGYRGLPMLLKALERRFDADFVRKLDDRQKAKLAKARQIIIKLEAGIPGLKELIEDVQKSAERGYLKAIDGSKVIVRKPHAALNTLLQSAGAITCKRWMRMLHEELERLGLRGYHPVFRPTPDLYDYRQVLWVHDELQFTHRPGLGPIIAEAAERMIVAAGESLGLRGRYRSDAKTGLNWAECH